MKNTLLHKLLQKIASRAYSLGFNDGASNKTPDETRVYIDPALLRKLL